MKFRIALTLVLAIATAVAAGQEPVFVDRAAGVTLEEAVRLALEREPSLRAIAARVDAARGDQIQAGLRPNPTSAFTQQNEPGGMATQSRAELRWPLDLFRRDARVAVASEETEVAAHLAADAARRLAARVREQYGDVAEAVRMLRVVGDVADATARQLTLLSARVDEGASRPLDRDMLVVELRRVEAERARGTARVEAAMFELRRLIGLPPSAPLAIRETLDGLVPARGAPEPPVIPLEQREDLQAAGARLATAEARVRLARQEGRFDASIMGAYARMDAPFMDGPSHQAAIGVSVTLPLRNDNRGAVAAAEGRRSAASAELEALSLAAQSEIASARARESGARRALAIYRDEAVALAGRNLDVVRQTYDLGRATVFDVLDQQRRYLEIERAYTAALKEVFDARQALRLALGGVQ
jgi:cobalt-zinc-cadmium efflux system outer membrane protein